MATASLVGERAAEEAGLFSGVAAQAVSIIAVITLAENENNFLFMAFHSLRKLFFGKMKK